MTDYDGPEPTDDQIESTQLPGDDIDEFWHERLVLRIMRDEADPDGVYRGSIKWLALATGLPFHDVHMMLLVMQAKGWLNATNEGVVLRTNTNRPH